MRLFFTVGLSICLLFSVLSLSAAEPAKNGIPTTVNSDNMEYDAAAQTVIFTGNVHVLRPDFELWSKKLTIYLKKSSNSGSESSSALEGMRTGDVDRLVAQGAVRIKSEQKSGECEKATYYTATDKIVMEGSPVLRDPETVIKGTTITHYMNENKSHVGGRVNAVFEAPDKTEDGASPQKSSAKGGKK